MTSFFPDLNVWLALSDEPHVHNTKAWKWLNSISSQDRLIFARYTQIGLLRLLTTSAVMNENTQTLGKAWSVYDGWLEDPRVAFHPEPRNLELAYRDVTTPIARFSASKAVGDCFLIAFAQQTSATLVTFDKALQSQARKAGCSSIVPA